MGDGTRAQQSLQTRKNPTHIAMKFKGKAKIKSFQCEKKNKNLEAGTVLTGYKNGETKQPLTVQTLRVSKSVIRFKTTAQFSYRTCHRILLMLKAYMGL